MIKTEFYSAREDGINLIRTYSDQNFMILQTETGILYEEAIDPENINREYLETDIPIEQNDSIEEESYEE